jgi:hypothetical protein
MLQDDCRQIQTNTHTAGTGLVVNGMGMVHWLTLSQCLKEAKERVQDTMLLSTSRASPSSCMREENVLFFFATKIHFFATNDFPPSFSQ